MKLNQISLSLLFLIVSLFAVDVAAQKVNTTTQKNSDFVTALSLFPHVVCG